MSVGKGLSKKQGEPLWTLRCATLTCVNMTVLMLDSALKAAAVTLGACCLPHPGQRRRNATKCRGRNMPPKYKRAPQGTISAISLQSSQRLPHHFIPTRFWESGCMDIVYTNPWGLILPATNQGTLDVGPPAYINEQEAVRS